MRVLIVLFWFYDLLIAKVHAHACDIPSLKLPNFCLRNRHQYVKINNFYGLLVKPLFGGLLGSMLGHIFFNVFLCDLFLFNKNKDVASYAKDATLYEADFAYVIQNFRGFKKYNFVLI